MAVTKTQNYRVADPYMNEYIFHCIVTTPPEELRKLPPDLLAETKSVQKIKSFIQKASLERKLQMLSCLGGAFSLVLHPPKYVNKKKIATVLKHFQEGRRLDDVNEMIKDKVYVITDKEVMAAFTVMSQNCHSETYSLNKDYSLISTEIVHEKFAVKDATDQDILEVMEDYRLMLKLLLNNLVNQSYDHGMTSFKPQEIMVLMYLFLYRNKYMHEKDIVKYFITQLSTYHTKAAIRSLEKSAYIQRFPRTYTYTLTGLGVHLIAAYTRRIVSLTMG